MEEDNETDEPAEVVDLKLPVGEPPPDLKLPDCIGLESCEPAVRERPEPLNPVMALMDFLSDGAIGGSRKETGRKRWTAAGLFDGYWR